jgi:hypothetical protein
VYLVIVDGLGAEAATAARMPRLTAAAARPGGSWVTARAVMPTRTNANHASLLTGVFADVHGITGNWYGTGHAERELDAPELLDVETLFTTLARERPEARTVAAFAKGKLRRLFGAAPGQRAPTRSWSPPRSEVYAARDAETMAGFRALVAEAEPALGVVALADVDGAGHAHGPASAAYATAVAAADEQIGLLVDDLVRTGAWARSVVVVTADHGFEALHPGAAGHLEVAALAPPGVQLVSDGGVAHAYPGDGGPAGEAALRALVERARAHPGVAAVYARRAGLGAPAVPADWRLQHPRAGDVLLVAARGVTFVDGPTDPTRAFAGNHGSPRERAVPLVIAGGHPALRRMPAGTSASAVDVAPTIAALLGIPPPRRGDGARIPSGAGGRVLPVVAGGE